ncbi:hypothetical protein F4680DRAFT_198398 [Xylaria scruposa]|nr:hypothetical protein F4680DRAFT_198398 [Xylaria scruposa]
MHQVIIITLLSPWPTYPAFTTLLSIVCWGSRIQFPISRFGNPHSIQLTSPRSWPNLDTTAYSSHFFFLFSSHLGFNDQAATAPPTACSIRSKPRLAAGSSPLVASLTPCSILLHHSGSSSPSSANPSGESYYY